jgi:hypothetical protein
VIGEVEAFRRVAVLNVALELQVTKAVKVANDTGYKMEGLLESRLGRCGMGHFGSAVTASLIEG